MITLQRHTEPTILYHLTTKSCIENIKLVGLNLSPFGDLIINNNNGRGVYAIRNLENHEELIKNMLLNNRKLYAVQFKTMFPWYECIENDSKVNRLGYVVIPINIYLKTILYLLLKLILMIISKKEKIMDKKMQKESKLLSYILRHHPEEFGLEMDDYGYVNVDKLVENTKFTKERLMEIVSQETRYGLSPDKSMIKAFHGHSVPVIYTDEITPPDELYHGTSTSKYELIKKSGAIKGMTRVQVHLSESETKAKEIGTRHGRPIVLVIDAKKMASAGILFYKSKDNVYLTDEIPIKYVKKEILEG